MSGEWAEESEPKFWQHPEFGAKLTQSDPKMALSWFFSKCVFQCDFSVKA